MNDRKSHPANPGRRRFLATGAVALVGAGLVGSRYVPMRQAAAATSEHFAVSHSDAEWRSLLTPEQYAVLRRQGTERPFSSPLDHEKRNGTFVCAGCDHPLFSSKTKFDSKTGWPSFWQPLPNGVSEARDTSLGVARTEIHCRQCGGHLGHVFDDGPRPTGLRYCMNGVAMKFQPAV